MLGSLGPAELLIIGAIALLIFGPRRLPELGRSLGQTIKEFRGVGREIEKGLDDDPPPPKGRG
jgi:sec-independent protein translocase protein TatA